MADRVGCVSGPTGRSEPEALRVIEVHLGQDSALSSVTSSDQVVVNHGIDSGGALYVLSSHNGEVHRQLIQDVLSEQSAVYRATHPHIGVDPHTELLNWVSKKQRQLAYDLQQHILDVVEGRLDTIAGRAPSQYDRDTTTDTQRRRAKEKELGWTDDKLGRKIRDWRDNGPLFLIPHVTRALTSNGAADVAPEILAVVRHRARNRHLSSKKDRTVEYGQTLDELRRHGLVSAVEGAVRADGTPIPFERDALSYDAFAKQIRHLDRGKNHRTAKTRQQQSKRPRVTSVHHRGFDFGDRIEVDSTLTDIHVWGPDGPVRLWAVFAICVSTRYCWLRLVREAPRGIHLGLLLFDMIGGEAFTTGKPGEDYTAIQHVPFNIDVHGWPGPGRVPDGVLPGCIAADHGAEEENSYFISLCSQLGIPVHWARTMSPTDKSFVESHIKKFATMCQLMPGHKGNTVENRPHQLDTELPTFEYARHAFKSWSQWMGNQPHSGLPHNLAPGRFLTPIEAVNISVTRGVPLRVLSDPTLPLRLLLPLSLTPQDDGITWGKKRYTGRDYEDVVQASLDGHGRRRKLTFYYDPDAPHRLLWPQPGGTFAVHSFSAPGRDSGVSRAFDEVREALEKNLSGQKWPTHNEWGSRRADLLQTLRSGWEEDGLTGTVVNLAHRRTKKASKGGPKSAPSELPDNAGWDFSAVAHLLDAPLDDWADDDRTDQKSQPTLGWREGELE